MYKHILVPLDGSSSSEAVLPLVARLAMKLAARVTLLHIIERNPPVTIHSERHLKDKEEAGRYLESVSRNVFPQRIEVDTHVHEVPSKDVAGTIVAHKSEFQYDLVVMSIHGTDRGRRFMFGNLAQRILAEGSIAVLFVKSSEIGKEKRFFNPILVPLDVAHDQSHVTSAIKDLAKPLGSKVELVAVIETMSTLSIAKSVSSIFLPMSARTLMENHELGVKKYLDTVQKELEGERIGASHSILKGDVAKSILAKARTMSAGLIVMGTHGSTGTKAFWNESVSNKISSACAMPVLLIPITR